MRVGDVGRDKHSPKRDDGDGEQPEIPRHDEAGKFVESDFGPLIDAALKRHQAI